jgi:hypothetical protein
MEPVTPLILPAASKALVTTRPEGYVCVASAPEIS